MSPNPNNRKRANMIDISLDKDESDEDNVRDRRKNITKSHSFEERFVKTANGRPHQSLSHTIVPRTVPEKKQSVSSLVDELLCDIYGKSDLKRKGSSATNGGDWSWHDSDCRQRGNPRFRSNLKQMEMKCWSKDVKMIKEEIAALESLVVEESNNLVKYLKRKDYLLMRREAHYDVITAVIQAISSKTRDDMKMKFSLAPGTETGFSQWLDAMKMVAQLPGGVPSEFRTKLWLQLSERHLTEKNIDWEKAEAIIFNEWTNPDDEELGVQIVKDLHRTGCSLFCGAQEQNQALLKRVLLAYARWNKNVGYCQGFNMLAALILQVMDRDEKNSVKVMIYLIEGVLPESYFANNLRGLSVDMAVFRDLLRLRLPKLSKHLEALQNDTNSGTCYEPPLTNVFTMQWFLTLFSNCLPQQTVLRVWDLVFLHGNEVLLRTALAIWGILQDRIISVESADEFYSIMGVVTREMLEFGLMDANNLVKMIVMIDPFPNELQELREKYLYNISPWTQSVQSAAKKGIKLFYSDPEDQDDTEDEDKIALATAYGVFRRRESGTREIQAAGPTLDISALKQQYAKLKQRQRQAHIIISAACGSNITANLTSVPTVSVNHLLLGKSALVNKGRRIGPPEGSIPPPKSKSGKASEKEAPKKEKPSGETLEWKDAEKRKISKKEKRKTSSTHSKEAKNVIKNKYMESCNGVDKRRENETKPHLGEEEIHNERDTEPERKRRDSSGSSTSTELCDDDNRSLSDIELEEILAEAVKTEPPMEKIRYEDVKKCAEELIREIEEKIQKSDRLKNQKYPQENNNNYIKLQDLAPSKQDNVSEITTFTVDKECREIEPEVPSSVTDSAENKIFDRSKVEDREEEPKRDKRDRRKSDLALSVIRENLEMLNKFSHKVREEGAKKEDERTDLYGDHFRKGEAEEKVAPPQVTTKVNKEVNTDITIAADSETSPKLNPEKSKGDDFLINLISGRTVHKSPDRFKPERVGYLEEADRYGREDLAEKWKKESERIESKIEMSKSDWDLKMKKIAELENTTREKLNEMRTKSMSYRHRSLDRFEGREKRKSPIPKIQVSEDETGDSGKRKKRISALSFDEITSRTEKLLGTNLSSETGSRKWRKSFDEEAPQYEFHSSPTSPEYRHRKYTEYFSPKRYETRWKYSTPAAAVEEDWLTISEEDGKPDRIELASHGRKPETNSRSPTTFNPFPTRPHTRPKELGVRLGMYPSSPKSPQTSKKS